MLSRKGAQRVSASATARANVRRKSVFAASKIPTMHFQKSLPLLPVPKLEDTISRFTEAVEPILSESEFAEFSSVLQDFAKHDGTQLHNQLLGYTKDRPDTSYITEFWFDMYLKDRRQIPFTHTPFMTTTLPPYDLGSNPQSKRATNSIISALKFKEALDNGTMKPDVYYLNPKTADDEIFQNVCRFTPQQFSYFAAYAFKAYALDMSQYANLFSSTRIPQEGKDKLVVNPNARNVVFLRNGHLYSVDVLDREGKIIDAQELMQNIEWILCDTSGPSHPPGVFTTMDRDSWTGIRKHLIEESAENEESLRMIDGSLFVVSLEDHTLDEAKNPKTETEKTLKHLLTGDGKNRWFDKCLNLIVFRDGNLTIQFEHSWGDGVSVLRFLNDICKDSFTEPAITADLVPTSRSSSSMQDIVKRLKIIPKSDITREATLEALLSFQQKSDSLDISTYRGFDMGTEHCKTAKISPDSLMQLAIQLAYFKISDGKTVPTYESCTTCAFKHGRTETVRSCTKETKAFTNAFYQNDDKSTLQDLLKKCSSKHGELTKNAATGQGSDRHLFAMKQLALANESIRDQPLPALFRHELYDKVHHFILSTSTVPSEYCGAGGFCPVVPDGLGVGYDIQKERMGFSVTSYNGRKCHDFTDAVPDIVTKLKQLLS